VAGSAGFFFASGVRRPRDDGAGDMAEKEWGREERVRGRFVRGSGTGAGEATGQRRSFREVEEERLVCLKARRWAAREAAAGGGMLREGR
jgi:hypothetical protein